MKEVMVTGGAGFIGSHLQDALVEQGHAVTVIDNLSHGLRQTVNKRATFYEVDIRNQDQLTAVVKDVRPEVIFHLAAQTDVSTSMMYPTVDHDINVRGTVILLSAARNLSTLETIVFSSSAAVYGDVNQDKLPVVEDCETNPKSFYGLSKLTGEKYLELFGSEAGFNGIVLRYSNVYGPRQSILSEGGVISTFINRTLRGRAVTINGDGHNTRDYIYVGDIVRANLAAMSYDDSNTFNISSNTEISTQELFRLITQVLGIEIPPAYGPIRIGDIYRSRLCNQKAIDLLKWIPQVNLTDGIKRMIE